MYINDRTGEMRDFNYPLIDRIISIVDPNKKGRVFEPVFGKNQPVYFAVGQEASAIINSSELVDKWTVLSQKEQVFWYQFDPEDWRIFCKLISLSGHYRKLASRYDRLKAINAEDLAWFIQHRSHEVRGEATWWGISYVVGYSPTRCWISQDKSVLFDILLNENTEKLNVFPIFPELISYILEMVGPEELATVKPTATRRSRAKASVD